MEFKRKSEKTMVIGIHPMEEALDAGMDIDKVFIQQGLRSEAISGIIHNLKQQNIHFQQVPVQKLNRMTSKNHQGVIAFRSSVSFTPLDEMAMRAYEGGTTPTILVLDRITDVRNFGAIARTAECLGCSGIVVPSANSAQMGEDAMKTSAGALAHIAVSKVSHLPDAVQYLKDSGFQIVGCTEKGGKALNESDLSAPTAIVMGSEENGISNAIMDLCDQKVLIPMVGKVNSLNVSVAAGMVLYETIRQRN